MPSVSVDFELGPNDEEVTRHYDPFGGADVHIHTDTPDPDAGGASHVYVIEIDGNCVGHVQFQHGPRGENGKLTGANDIALLAIVADRLQCFQGGDFAHESNQRALNHIRDAMDILRSRTAERKVRGVLGLNQQ